VFNRPHRNAATTRYFGSIEPTGENRFKAILVRGRDGQRFVIAKNLVEREARELAAAVLCAPDPPYAAGFLGGKHEIAQARQRAREREQRGEPSAFPRLTCWSGATP
jgi:hypothetical protein